MAGITLSQMVQDLRGILLDVQPPYQWPDPALQQALQEAIATHSFLFPRQVRLRFDVAAGQTRFALFGLEEGPPATALGYTLDVDEYLAPGAANSVMVTAIQRVELPVPIPIPQDGGQITDPAASGATAYKQAWRWQGDTLVLRNPAAAAQGETGPGQLAVELVQTYSRPDTAGVIRWNGPVVDQSFVYLLATRAAYQQLIGGQLRDGELKASLDVGKILTSLETEIARALKSRGRRALRSRTLDI